MPAAMMSRSDGKSAPGFRPNPSKPSNAPPNSKPSSLARASNAARPASPPRQTGVDQSARQKPGTPDARPEQKILCQSFFKSVGPRTYAAQVKEAGNGNHFILLTEGNRDKATGE